MSKEEYQHDKEESSGFPIGLLIVIILLLFADVLLITVPFMTELRWLFG